MSPPHPPAMELLAPAGTTEAFATAVAAGADAVYIGAPALNARALAKNFSLAEIAAMVEHAHRHRVKVYVAMNSLVREEEIPAAVETLAALEALGVDALIIQDLGLYWLARHHFPKLRLHASTLLAGHNSLAVRQFADMGFQRVVLARELTLEEIGAIHRQTPVEIEVFVHGALCFSYSGLCLFSSYLGGKSGLRGRCVQPCRRRYSWAGKGKGKGKGGGQSGYFFSMNDLCAIDLIPQLAEAGVRSLKIEGRMRSPRYVGAVVSAYRLALDAAPGDQQALAAAHERLEEAMGRRSTSGYFTTPQPEDALSPQHSGNVGLFLGRVAASRGQWAQLQLKEPLRCGDRLRIHQEKSGDRQAFTLKGLQVDGVAVDKAPAGSEVAVQMPGSARPGDSLYKVDVSERRDAAEGRRAILPGSFRGKVPKRAIGERAGRVLQALRQAGVRASVERSGPQSSRPVAARGRKKGGSPLPWWLRIDDLGLLRHPLPELPERIVVTLTAKTAGQLQRQRRQLGPLLKRLVWALPPIILEADLPFYRRTITTLERSGFKEWQLGHVGQLPLFAAGSDRPDQPKGKGRGGPRRGVARRPVLIGDYTLNVLNSLTLRCLDELGFSRSQCAVESDRDNLRAIGGGHGVETGLTVHGAVPLFIARLKAAHFQYDRTLVSPKDERFLLKEAWGQTIAVSETVFSLLGRLEELAALGLRYGVVDLSFLRLRKGDLEGLVRQAAGTSTRGGKPSRQRTGTFNFFGKLL